MWWGRGRHDRPITEFRSTGARHDGAGPDIVSTDHQLYQRLHSALDPGCVSGAMVLRARPQAAKLMIVWCVITLVALYAPTTIQRRFISGVHVPIAILAGLGICRVWMPGVGIPQGDGRGPISSLPALHPRSRARDHRVTLAHTPDFFLSTDESQALAWLEDHAKPDGVVLSSPELGAFVPAFTSQRVVVGHWAETVDFAGTAEKVKRMYATAADSTALCAALTQWGVSYVLVGPRRTAYRGQRTRLRTSCQSYAGRTL